MANHGRGVGGERCRIGAEKALPAWPTQAAAHFPLAPRAHPPTCPPNQQPTWEWFSRKLPTGHDWKVPSGAGSTGAGEGSASVSAHDCVASAGLMKVTDMPAPGEVLAMILGSPEVSPGTVSRVLMSR